MKLVHVAAGAILDPHGKVLLTRRHDDSHQGGLWEFPGGKVEQDEQVMFALRRELEEELGIEVQDSRPLIKVTHHYDDLSVCLDVHVVNEYAGEPAGLEGQPLEWRDIHALDGRDMPAADIPIINALKLPDRYLITGQFADVEDFDHRLTRALESGVRLVQLRIKPHWYESHMMEYNHVLARAIERCDEFDAILMLNVPDNADDGSVMNLHLDSVRLHQYDQKPTQGWLAASCHSIEDLKQAERIEADFAVLSPVEFTDSHPDAESIGWAAFSHMIEQVNIPVYALGGMELSHIGIAHRTGGQGIAGIGAMWE